MMPWEVFAVCRDCAEPFHECSQLFLIMTCDMR